MLASLSTGACWLLTSSSLNVKACHCSFQIAYIIFLSSSSHDREWLFSNLANTVTYLVFKAILSLCRLRPCCSLTAHLCPLILSQHLIMNYSTLGLQLMCAIKRQEYNTHNEPVSPWKLIKAGGSAETRPLKVVLMLEVQDSALFYIKRLKSCFSLHFSAAQHSKCIIHISLGVTGHDTSQNVMSCLARHSESCNSRLKWCSNYSEALYSKICCNW